MDKQEKTDINMDLDTINSMKTKYYVFFEFVGYFAIFIILFAFMYELNAYVFIFILILIMHIVFNLKFFKEVKNIFETPSNNILSMFISFILFSTMIMRTLGLFLFSYTNGKVTYITKTNDEKIRIPKSFKKNDLHYKFLFIASTIASFIIFFLIKFYDTSVLKTDISSDNSMLIFFITMILGAISYGFSNIIPHTYLFETVVYSVTFFITILTTIKLMMTYLTDIDMGSTYYQLIAFITTCSLAITSSYEFKNAYEYKDLHNKYELEKESPNIESESDKKMHYYKETIINILLLLFSVILFFIIGAYASGTGGSKPIYLFIIAMLISFYMLKDIFGDITGYIYNGLIVIVNSISLIINSILNVFMFIIKMGYNFIIKPILLLFKNILLLFKQMIKGFTSLSNKK